MTEAERRIVRTPSDTEGYEMPPESHLDPGTGGCALLATIIVPARNASPTLPTCLAALTVQTAGWDALSDTVAAAGVDGKSSSSSTADQPPNIEARRRRKILLEVIVVDDGSTDGTGDIARRWAASVTAPMLSARVIATAPQGAAAARNAGAAAACGPVLLFTDADCRPAPDWAARILQPFADANVSAAMGRFRSDQGTLIARITQAEYAAKEQGMIMRGCVAFFDTATAAVRTDVFMSVGRFRETMAAVEDTELAFRLLAAGYTVHMVPDAFVYHGHPATLRAYVRRKVRFGRWGARAYLGHPERVADDGRTSWTMRLQLVLAPLMALSSGWMVATRGRHGLPAISLLILLFIGSTLPLSIAFWRRGAGPAVALIWPIVAVLRAFALCGGLSLGLAEMAVERVRSAAKG